MNRYRAGDFFAVLLVVVGVSAAAAAATPPLTSRWPDREIRVDGVNDEWPETSPLEEMINVGAANDGEFLYFTVITSDEVRRRQLATAGLVVWLDSSGGKKQSFGIRLPGTGFFAGGQRGRRGGANDAPPEVQPPTMTYIELLGPGKKDRRRIELTAGADISAAAGSREGTVVYELRVPLAKTPAHEYAIGTEPGRKIGVGLETPEMERPEGAPGDRGFGGGGRGGGRGGFGGGRGGGRAGGGRGGAEGRNFQQPKPLKVWTTIQLAKGGADVAPASSR